MSDIFAKILWNQIVARPRNIFIQDRERSFSYRQLAAGIRQWCMTFDHCGITSGSRVVIVCRDEIVASTVFLAALLDVKVPVMLNPDTRIERIAAVCRVTEPALVVVDDPVIHSEIEAGGFKSQLANPTLPQNKPAGFFRSQWERREETSQRAPCLEADNDALAYILFTSGTTGEPSGVEITHGALSAHMATLTRLFEYGSSSCIANPTPLSHTDGLTQGLLLAAVNGARLLRPGRFALDDLESWLDQFCRHGVTHFITNPTVIVLIEQFAAHDDYFHFDEFKAVISSASILRPELWNVFEQRFGCRLYNLYGMTETVANATYAGEHPEMGERGTIGVPIDCEARIVDPSDGFTQVEGPGELQLRGAHICRGYWRNPGRNQRSFMAGGWFRTGDLVCRDGAGNLKFIGRLKSMINAGGLSIAPEEIDEALLRHPAVTESVTVGLPHEEFEEIAASAVVLNQDVDPEQLLEHARRHLEPLKVPKQIMPVYSIPRGAAGKPDLALVKALLQSEVERPAAEPAGTVTVSLPEVINLAARVFNVDASSLSPETSPSTLQSWDSFNHLTLMLEAEKAFGLTIPTAKIAGIRSLRDLYEAICVR